MRRATALWALAVIFIANFFNYMDRMLVSAQEEQLSAAFSLSKEEFGWLWSLFTIGYLTCAIPIGYLADHYNRPRLFAWCVVIWSAATIATGLAPSTPAPTLVLYVSRFLIGVGEAGCLIIGPALLSDYFSLQGRGKALAVFYLGQPLGGTAGFALPGELLQRGLAWSLSFYIAGGPGFAIAALLLLLRDPPRGTPEEAAARHGPRGASPRQYLELFKNRTLLLIIFAQTFSVVVLIPLLHFGKDFMKDKHQLDERGATYVMLIVMIAGSVGMALSGIIGGRLARRYQGAYALLAGVGYLLSFPCLLIAFNAETYWGFLPAMAFGGFCMFLCMPAVNTQIANVVSADERATAYALAVCVLHLLGDTAAPPIFGRLAGDLGDHIGSEIQGTQLAFTIFSVAMILAAVCSLFAARTARRDIERFVTSAGASETPSGSNSIPDRSHSPS